MLLTVFVIDVAAPRMGELVGCCTARTRCNAADDGTELSEAGLEANILPFAAPAKLLESLPALEGAVGRRGKAVEALGASTALVS